MRAIKIPLMGLERVLAESEIGGSEAAGDVPCEQEHQHDQQ